MPQTVSPKIGKRMGTTMIVLFILLGCSLVYGWYLSYIYNNQIDAYFNLADQASTIEKKEEYLKQYADALKKAGLDHGQARYFFTTPYSNLETQYGLLETLMERLTEIQKMNPNSFEYQKAIEQITEQEFGGFDRDIFYDGWIRQNPLVYTATLFGQGLFIPFFIIPFFIFFSILKEVRKKSS